MTTKGARIGRLSSWLAALAIIFACAGHLTAHEIQPAVADLEFVGDRVGIRIEMALEAPLAGIDLDGLADTNEAGNADAYDRLRALPPEALDALLREAWPGIARQITILSGDTALTPELLEADIPETGDTAFVRTSALRIAADLPSGDAPLVFGWDAALGGLIVRQMGVEEGYTAYLTNGALTDPIPREGSSSESALGAFIGYVGVGFDHIVPKGLDHILFVLGLFFLATRIGPLLWQVSAFTLAHTVTLALGALDLVRIPGEIVEPIIAASIVYVGVENVLARGMQPWRPAVVFGFGLLHGLGFASVLSDFGLGASHFVPKLIGFNVGVELGQLAVIAAAWLALGAFFARFGWYKTRLAAPVSVAIAAIAFFWVLERTGLAAPDGIWTPFAAIAGGGMPVLWGGLVAAAVIVLLTIAVLAGAVGPIRDACGFLTSLAAFVAVTGAFTAGGYLVMVGLVALWIVALRAQSMDDAGGGTLQAA